jgi:hypothetical protein
MGERVRRINSCAIGGWIFKDAADDEVSHNAEVGELYRAVVIVNVGG